MHPVTRQLPPEAMNENKMEVKYMDPLQGMPTWVRSVLAAAAGGAIPILHSWIEHPDAFNRPQLAHTLELAGGAALIALLLLFAKSGPGQTPPDAT